MDEEAAFLNAIAANREDDGPRLIFADWFEENGQADRAEFIRLQIHEARCLSNVVSGASIQNPRGQTQVVTQT